MKWPLVILSVVVLCVGIFALQSSPMQFHDRQQRQVTLGGKILQVEVVTAPASIEKGLGGRSSIGSDGMLFVFSQSGIVTFWMKDMVMDLDFVWLHKQKIVDITENVPAPRTPEENADEKLKLYSPTSPIDMVLELPAGSVQKNGFQIGDTLKF